MDDVGVSCLDIQDSLEFLRDALTIHFMNIRDADTCFGYDHAEILKFHIESIATNRPGDGEASRAQAESLAEIPVLPRAISRFAPRATLDPAPNWGLLGRLPREIRDVIYEDVFSHDCSSYLQACSCTKEDRQSKSGIALLRACGKIHNEVVPLLYKSEVFAISLGYELLLEEGEATVHWRDPVFYRYTTFGRQIITYLPHNAFSLIQNLKLMFTDDTMLWVGRLNWNFFASTDRMLHAISQVCTNLQDCVQLRHLDIHFSFCCRFSDIDYMARLLEPIKKLRGIKDPDITVSGYQYANISGRHPSNEPEDPRWVLTDEYTEYLKEVLMSLHGTPTIPSDGLQIFEDDYECSEPDDFKLGNDTEEEFMTRYLRDVYGTEDLEALHGGMPERWQNWLNSEHDEACEWFNAVDEVDDGKFSA